MKVRASQLDLYQWYLDTEMTTAELLAAVDGRQEPTAAMQTGSAFHKLMEYAAIGDVVDEQPAERGAGMVGSAAYVWHDGALWRFGFADADLVVERGRPEVAVSGKYGGVTLTGHVDLLLEDRVVEYKTSTKGADAERLMHSWQWQAYLALTGRQRCTYQHVQLRPRTMAVNGRQGRCFDAVEVTTVDCFAYDGMENAVAAHARDFAATLAAARATANVTPM